jgi:hypothetical protein
MYGLETCQAFRQHSDPAEHFLGAAGTFNTGWNNDNPYTSGSCMHQEH